jgi:hypothetical protein
MGSQTGSQHRQPSSDAGRRPATVGAARCLFRLRQTTSRDGKIAPYKRGVTGSKPVAPTTFSQVDGLLKSQIKEPTHLRSRPWWCWLWPGVA